MTASPLERLASYFRAGNTRQGLLARAILGASAPGDAELAGRLTHELVNGIRADGTVAGAALPTIWRAHKLFDLGCATTDPAVSRLIRCVLDMQGGPGAFGEGCDRDRHTQWACEHYVQGFFSPAPSTVRLAPLTFPNGKVYRAEPAARFALSCLALRVVLRTGAANTPATDQHLRSLTAIASGWTTWTGFFPPDVIIAGMHALAMAGPAYRPTVASLVALVAANQDSSGAWPNADLFHTIEALTATDLPEARETVRRAVPALVARQREDGTFGAAARDERGLIALRALVATGDGN
jgi:hypothetical protein